MASGIDGDGKAEPLRPLDDGCVDPYHVAP
jgi:hypothetical protein